MNGYESVENRWLKPGSLPPMAFMGTSGKWGFHGYEFDVLQCHKPPIGDGLLVKLGMLYDWHPIIVIQLCWQLRMDFMSSACQVAIEHGETSATNIPLKSVEFIFLILIMMNLSWWTYHLLYLLHLEISRLSCETPESQKGRCQLPPPQMCVIEHDSCSKPQTHGKPNRETQMHWAIISGFWMILVVSW